MSQNYILCTDGRRAFVGDMVRVAGMPERFFFDEKIKVVGVIREIAWYDDDSYYGFVLEDTNKFYVVNCDEIALVE